MKMRKRYRPFLLALCLCLSLTACGGPDGDIAGGDWRTTGVVDAYDPLHVIHFNMARMNTNSAALTFPALLTSHMFEATCSSATSTLEISVTDGFGRTYSETMQRPRELYDMSKSSDW